MELHGHLVVTMPIPISKPMSFASSGGDEGGQEDAWSNNASSTPIDTCASSHSAMAGGHEVISSRDGYFKPPTHKPRCRSTAETP
ncbi:hypothetical protein E2562_007077 [Oryza meyeriana var. granulata]|uniref:Uncharacterized protein n=1 Tax=Oryza meyeriana var. granulata TaxID=110450 RepID=A0A6G1F4X7_9ORYZ|nr:hypothetical protein E2562_007077 [Oryza meyeriana var. granulata]